MSNIYLVAILFLNIQWEWTCEWFRATEPPACRPQTSKARNTKCDYFLSTGFPGTVWQDRGLYIRPPIKDSVEKSCPGGVKLQSLPYHVLYIAPWATAKCTENFKCGAAHCLFIVDVMCMRERTPHREPCEQKAGYLHRSWVQLGYIFWVKDRWVLLNLLLTQSHSEKIRGALICQNM